MTDIHPSQPPRHLTTEAGRVIAYHSVAGKASGVVFLGGFMSDMGGTKATALEAHCRAAGRAYTRFDYSGHGASEGVFRDGTIGSWLSDTLAVIDQATSGPLVLVGSSMGGWLAALAALQRPERVVGLVTVAAAPDFTERLIWHELDHEAKVALAHEGYLEEPSPYMDEPKIITHELVVEGRDHLLLDRGTLALHCPLRLLHGLADAEVPWQLSRDLLDAAASPDAVLCLIKGGDHRLSRPAELARLFAAVDELAA